jgi:hypothetical protein
MTPGDAELVPWPLRRNTLVRRSHSLNRLALDLAPRSPLDATARPASRVQLVPGLASVRAGAAATAAISARLLDLALHELQGRFASRML